MKYILYTDYASGQSKQYKYQPLKAKNLLDAIAEADETRNNDPREIYLTRIMERERFYKDEDGYKHEIFKAVLCERSYGWHLNNQENCENVHRADFCNEEYKAI